MDEDADTSGDPVSLDVERSRRFLRRLAEDPFIAVVVTDEGKVSIFSKGIEDDHLDRIKTVLRELEGE